MNQCQVSLLETKLITARVSFFINRMVCVLCYTLIEQKFLKIQIGSCFYCTGWICFSIEVADSHKESQHFGQGQKERTY